MALQNRSPRKFLKTTASLALVTASSIRKVMGSDDRLRVGFIGIGLIGQRHLLDFRAQRDFEIAAICEVYPPRLAEGIVLSMGKAQGFKDFRKMLGLKNLDAVVISTPDHWHALMAIMACAAGKDVYVEKPLAVSYPLVLGLLGRSDHELAFARFGHRSVDYRIGAGGCHGRGRQVFFEGNRGARVGCIR